MNNCVIRRYNSRIEQLIADCEDNIYNIVDERILKYFGSRYKDKVYDLDVSPDGSSMVRILFPFKFFVKPVGFKDIYYSFLHTNGLWKEEDVLYSEYVGTRPVESFINQSARMHQEILGIFDNNNKSLDDVLFGMFKINHIKLRNQKLYSQICDLFLYDLKEKDLVKKIGLKLDDVRVYIFESGIGFLEWKFRFWKKENDNKVDDATDVVRFCNAVRSTVDFRWLCDISEQFFLSAYVNAIDQKYCNYDFFDRVPWHFFAVNIRAEEGIHFKESLWKALSDTKKTAGSDFLLRYSDKYICSVSNSVFRVGKAKWEINDQAAWFCFVFVLHQKYAISSLSNELMKIDSQHSFSRSYFLRNRLRQEEINYANFRRRYVFENISNKSDVERIYDYLRDKFEINKLLGEYKDSIKPLQDYAKIDTDKRRNALLFAFSFTTVVNVIANLILSVVQDKTPPAFNGIVLPIILSINIIVCIVAIVIYLKSRCMLLNKGLKQRINGKLKRRNKKMIDKNK